MARTALNLLILVIAASVTRVRSNSCEEVWFEDAKFDGEPFTCGERIVYLQTPQGGLLTEQEARVKTALENDLCADCWPWEKYREDGETERSAKRGIAIENHLLTAEMLSGLSHIISWGKTWDYQLQGGPSLDIWEAAGVEFYPMIWGSGTIENAQEHGLPEGRRALLGFNEPNFPEQANLHPYWAAYYWKDIEKIAEANNITYIVAPSMNYHWSFDPIDWLYQFFYHCADCKVDAIGLHVFACYANGLKYHLDRYRVFGKPMWVTEIACSDPHSPERLSAEGQMAYMREAIPLLEADEDVEMYAWFSYFKDQWAHPIVDGENGDAGLVHPNGTLTNLGNLFGSFAAGSNLTEINLTIPEWRNETNETSSTTTTESETLTTTKSVTTTVSETATSSTTGSETWSSTRTASTTVSSSVTVTNTETTTATETTTTLSSSLTDTTTGTTTGSSTSSSSQSSTATSATATSSTKTWSGVTSSSTTVTSTETTATATVTTTLSTTQTAVTATSTVTTSYTGTSSATTSMTATTTGSTTKELATASTLTSTATTTLSSTQWAAPATTKTQTTTRTLTTTLTSTLSSSVTETSTKAVLATVEATTTVATTQNSTTQSGTKTWTSTSASESVDTANTTTEWAHTNYTSSRHLTGTAPSTTMTQGGESTTYTLDEEEENETNSSELTCGEAVVAWCQSDPEAAPFLPLHHCSDWRLHDAMCTSPVGAQAAPQFGAGATLQEGSPLSVAFLIMAVLGAAMASAALTSAYHRQRCPWLRYLIAALCCGLCGRRPKEDEEQEDLKRAVSEKEWPGRCLNVLGNAKVAPAPGVLLPVEAVARRVASSPMANNALCEGSPVMGSLSMKQRAALSEVAVGTPVGTTPASRAAALNTLQEAMAKATDELSTWDEKQTALDQVGRLLAGGATANLPTALRQEAEAWQSRQDDRLRLARSLEAAVEKASALEDGALEAMGEDGSASKDNPLRELMARAKLSVDAGDREAMLAEAARRATAFQEELENQRVRLQNRRHQPGGDSSLLTAGALLEERDALSNLKEKVAAEFAALPGLREDGGGDEAWDTACDALEDAWKQLSKDVEATKEETQAALAEAGIKCKVAKSFESSDAERSAALAEAARRAAAFDEELQKQRQKLQKRAKGKGSSAPAVELGRLMEDQVAYQVLETERSAAMDEWRQFMEEEGPKLNQREANDWRQLIEALESAKTDVVELAPAHAEVLAQSGTWSGIAAKVKTGKLEVDSQEHLAMLAEAARRAANFDEELQKQRSQMKKRRKALQKGGAEQVDPLEACRALADEQALRKLAKEQAEACAQCEALAASADGEAKEAWTELGSTWAAMSKDLTKAEKEARESAKVMAGDAGSGLTEALGLVEEATGADMAGGSSRRLLEDDSDARRAALQEAARRIATFDEELAKQRAAMRRRRTEASGPAALGHALRDGAALRDLAESTAEQRSACEAAIQAAQQEGGQGAAAWEDLAKVWGRLQADVAEAAKEADADAEEACGDVAEVTQQLAFRGLAAAARRAAAFERRLQMLRREGTVSAGAGELRESLRASQVQELREELSQGTSECEDGLSHVAGDTSEPHAADCRSAWQELLNLWHELAADLDSMAEVSSAPASTAAVALRKVFDTSVDDAEKQTALALAARRAVQFDEELQRQRQRLVRRKKAPKEPEAEAQEPEAAECLRALGDSVALQALDSDREAAAASCREALAKAEVEQKWEEVEGWKQVIQVYDSGRAPLEEAKKEVEASGVFSLDADRVAGQRLVQQVARDQKQGAEACLKAVEKALNTDSGPIEELIEAQQQARSVKSNGGSTRRSRGAEVVAQVQTWDVLEEAQGLLNALKKGEAQGDANSAETMQVLKKLGDEAAKQLDAISATHAKETKAQEKPDMREAGCQTIFRLGGMAWHSNPAVQKLLEDLMKVSTQGPAADPDQVDKLGDEVAVIMEKWRKTFIDRNRQRATSARRQRPVDAPAMPPAQAPSAAPMAPQAPPVMLEADMMARAAAKKVEAASAPPASWGSIKRDEVKMTVESSSFQTSTFDSALPGRMPEAEDGSARQDQGGDRSTSPAALAPSGRIPMNSEHRRPRADSEELQPAVAAVPPAQGQSSEPVASRSRRRRDSENSNFHRDVSGSSVPEPEPPLSPGSQAEQPPASTGQEIDFLAQLGQIRQAQNASSSRAASKEEPREAQEPATGRPSSAVGRRGGPGDCSLLVPPANDASRSASPCSSVGSSSVSSGHRRTVLDPIARPRGPPLPSAGRLLLATAQQESRETSPHSARSSPRAP